MSILAHLRPMFAYKGWANAQFLTKIDAIDPAAHPQERRAALRLLNHTYVVDQIFAAHLTGRPHGFSSDNTADTPTATALGQAIEASDRWYIDYIDTGLAIDMTEPIAFAFTDGDGGCMSRLEMLTHVIIHGAYHRGEIGRLLAELSIEPPWDTFAVYLHRTEPLRRAAWSKETSAAG
ncbi:MAG: DinB family protein [Devosia sp.]|nr:DinB family protein [Devosia sp.]